MPAAQNEEKPAEQEFDPTQFRYRIKAVELIFFMLAINFLPMVGEFSSTWHYSLISALAIYLPAHFLDIELKIE
jgi:hypothetical protein